MGFTKGYPLSVAVATERGIISKEWNRGYRKYLWYADGGEYGYGTASEALSEYYNIVVPERRNREKLEAEIAAENKLLSGSGFPVYMNKACDRVEYLNPKTNQVEVVSVRKFRQRLFDLQDEFDMEVVYIDKPLHNDKT